jgi:eukaryotic-like serine/threonine-protein kinase
MSGGSDANIPPRSTPIGLARDLAPISGTRSSAETQPGSVVVSPTTRARIPQVGEIVQEKFLLESCIGSGGMGVVFQGEHLLLKTRIALKCLRTELVGDAAALARFLQEARLAASIENEHSTRIHDVGTTSDGTPYIVMEYLRGVALDEHLERTGPLPVADVVTIVLQLLAVLAEAHGKGLVHRDLKPANLFLQERSNGELWVKVMDFGISKHVGVGPAPNLGITTPHTLLGSPQYMSPEQLRDSSTVDHRSDIWSVGVMIYELLAGTIPFDAESLADLCAIILDRQPAPLRKFRGDVPPGLEDVILRTLSKDAASRPQNVGELALLLAPYAPESARAAVGGINAACLKSSRSARLSTPVLVERIESTPAPKTRRMSIAFGFALVVAAGAVAYVLAPRLLDGREPTAPSVSSAAIPVADSTGPSPSAMRPASTAFAAPAPSVTAEALPTVVRPASTVVAVPRVQQPASTRIRKTSQIKPVD